MQTLDYVAVPGQRLGHYRILEQIGAGGMGVVYRARDEHLDREVAIKVLPPRTLKDETACKRFRREAHVLSRLNHPNIATVHDFDSQGDIDYLVMEYVPGETLRDRISAGALHEDEIIRLSIQLAKGLAAAHHHRIVHCDLKPENVRIMPDGQVKILDFGLSQLIHNPLDPAITASSSSVIAGTLPYMSPEQLSGGHVDERADLFSFGVVLYEMATAQRPFSGTESCHVITAILQKEPIPPISLNPKVSPELERIILRCLEKKPADRYQSAKQVKTELRRAITARNTVLDTLAARLRRVSKLKIGALALLLGFLILSPGIAFRSRNVYALSASDSIVLSNFVNSTPDPVFDEALTQALTVELEQSPYLNIVSQTRVRETLALMGRSSDEVLTPDLGRELCQRVSAKAVLWGSISSLGKQYVIGLTAVECGSGNYLAIEQIQSADKEDVLKALGKAASRLRSKLGESLSSVQKFDTPLDQATTPSLDALKAYSLGRKAEYREGSLASIPFFKRAVELDANFAVAYAALGLAYSNLGEPGLANTHLQRAYELRDRVSEREKLRISAYYLSYLKGDLVKGSEAYELWAHAYPHDATPFGNLGTINFYMGRYDKALSETLEHLRLAPDDSLAYTNLIALYGAMNRIEDAKAAYREAIARKLEDLGLHGNLYGIAFLEGDSAEMERQAAWAVGKPGAEDVLLSFAADTEAYYGRLSKARELSQRAIDSAERNGQKETAAGWQVIAALREAEFGNFLQARHEASSALRLASTRDVQILAALAFARAGALPQARKLADDLAKSYSSDTLIVGYWLPTINAAIEIERGKPSKAVEILRDTTTYELGEPYPSFQLGGYLYPLYLRAQSYLISRRGAEAAAEFQRLLDNRNIATNSSLVALARLGLAHAYSIQGDTAKARASYDDFFSLWKGCDPDVRVMREARWEYTSLR